MFESYIGQQISVFNMNSTALSAEGLAYPCLCLPIGGKGL